MLDLLPAERAAALAEGPVTIDLDTCGVPELGRWSWPGLLCGPLILAGEAAVNRLALDRFPGGVCGRVVWPGRAGVAAAMGRRALQGASY
jgi:hypothetical protein